MRSTKRSTKAEKEEDPYLRHIQSLKDNHKQLALDKKNRRMFERERQNRKMFEKERQQKLTTKREAQKRAPPPAPPLDRQSERELEQAAQMGPRTPPYGQTQPISESPWTAGQKSKSKGETALWEEKLAERQPHFDLIKEFETRLVRAQQASSDINRLTILLNGNKTEDWQKPDLADKLKDARKELASRFHQLQEEKDAAYQADSALLQMSPWLNRDGTTDHTYTSQVTMWEAVTEQLIKVLR
jgi:hypothetical protein